MGTEIEVKKVVSWVWECPVCGVTCESDHDPDKLECWNCLEVFERDETL